MACTADADDLQNSADRSTRAAFHVATLGLVGGSLRDTASHGKDYMSAARRAAPGGSHERQLFFIIRPSSDIRLKRDIALVGRRDDGLGLYRYRYLWSDTVCVGVMAQEVALVHPDAVVRDGLNDYLRVDYGRLGLHLMTLPEWDARSKGERL